MQQSQRTIQIDLPDIPVLEFARPMRLDDISSIAIDTAIWIHSVVGSSLLESAYETLLFELLQARGLTAERQVTVSLTLAGVHLKHALRLDLLVENAVVIEIKSNSRNLPSFRQQTLTYLRLADLRLGLMINFGLPMLKHGLVRVVNDMPIGSGSALRINRREH